MAVGWFDIIADTCVPIVDTIVHGRHGTMLRSGWVHNVAFGVCRNGYYIVTKVFLPGEAEVIEMNDSPVLRLIVYCELVQRDAHA